MGILRTREEYLPVTCAILKPEDREAFFSAIKKHENGRPEHIARACETTIDIVNDWISGKSNVPYHSLQTLAHQYQLTMPAVGELRREYLAVSQAPARRENPQAPPPPGRTRERAPRARKEPRERPPKRERAERKPRRETPPKEAKPPRAQADEQPKRPEQPRRQERPKARRPPQSPKGPRVPGPSELLAYWVGMTLMTGRREGADLIMAADRRIGQNFAGGWAALTRDLFGVKPSLRMLDGGKVQEARFPVAGFEEFLDRLDLKDGKAFNEAGVPRWAWSNPAWKMGCLKGIVDARAHFQRAPAIILEGVPERLATAFLKMTTSLKLEAALSQTKAIEIRGAAAVDQYFENIGTGNMKLRDQYRAFKFPRGGRPQGESQPGEPSDEPGEESAGEPGAEPIEAGAPPAELPADEAWEDEGGHAPADKAETADKQAEPAEERQPGEQAAAPEVRPAAPPERHLTDEERLDAEASRKANASGQPSRFAPPPPQPKQDRPPRRHRTLFRGRPKR